MIILSGLFAFFGALLRSNSSRAVFGLCRSVIKFLGKAVDRLQCRRGLEGELYQCRAPVKNCVAVSDSSHERDSYHH
jgi:hypothetical protein